MNFDLNFNIMGEEKFSTEAYHVVTVGKSLYHGSPTKKKTLKPRENTGKAEDGVFMTPFPGIACLFVPSKTKVMGGRKYSKITFRYKQWNNKETTLKGKSVVVNIWHNDPDAPKLSGKTKGYLHRVETKHIKDQLKRFNLDPSQREVVYPGEVTPTDIKEVEIEWTSEYKESVANAHGKAVREKDKK